MFPVAFLGPFGLNFSQVPFAEIKDMLSSFDCFFIVIVDVYPLQYMDLCVSRCDFSIPMWLLCGWSKVCCLRNVGITIPLH